MCGGDSRGVDCRHWQPLAAAWADIALLRDELGADVAPALEDEEYSEDSGEGEEEPLPLREGRARVEGHGPSLIWLVLTRTALSYHATPGDLASPLGRVLLQDVGAVRCSPGEGGGLELETSFGQALRLLFPDADQVTHPTCF